jgi:hypothetical protein
MGWKCPECGTQNYKAGRCTGCNPRYCCVCDSHSRVSDIHHHHVSYKADVTIPVCAGCHKRIHFEDGFHDELLPHLSRDEAERRGVIG